MTKVDEMEEAIRGLWGEWGICGPTESSEHAFHPMSKSQEGIFRLCRLLCNFL